MDDTKVVLLLASHSAVRYCSKAFPAPPSKPRHQLILKQSTHICTKCCVISLIGHGGELTQPFNDILEVFLNLPRGSYTSDQVKSKNSGTLNYSVVLGLLYRYSNDKYSSPRPPCPGPKVTLPSAAAMVAPSGRRLHHTTCLDFPLPSRQFPCGEFFYLSGFLRLLWKSQ